MPAEHVDEVRDDRQRGQRRVHRPPEDLGRARVDEVHVVRRATTAGTSRRSSSRATGSPTRRRSRSTSCGAGARGARGRRARPRCGGCPLLALQRRLRAGTAHAARGGARRPGRTAAPTRPPRDEAGPAGARCAGTTGGRGRRRSRSCRHLLEGAVGRAAGRAAASAAVAAVRAWSRSHRMSSTSSRPTLIRTRSSGTPATASCSAESCWWVVDAGWMTSVRASPTFARWLASCRDSMKRRPTSRPVRVGVSRSAEREHRARAQRQVVLRALVVRVARQPGPVHVRHAGRPTRATRRRPARSPGARPGAAAASRHPAAAGTRTAATARGRCRAAARCAAW